MADLLIRGLDDDVVRMLKGRAESKGRSLNAEVKAMISRDLRYTPAEFSEIARRLRAETGPVPGDSTDIVRHDRDSR
jgi:plasmid stability protein